MKSELQNQDQIQDLVKDFVRYLRDDLSLSHVHDPMYTFDWNRYQRHLASFYTDILLQGKSRHSNTLYLVIKNMKEAKLLSPHYLGRYVQLWAATVYSKFEGKNAKRAVEVAREEILLIYRNLKDRDPQLLKMA